MVKNPNPLNWFVSNPFNPAEKSGELKSSYAKLNGASERLSPPQQLSLKRLNVVARATEGLGTVTFNTSTALVNDGRVADVVNKIATVARNSGTHEVLVADPVAGIEQKDTDKVIAADSPGLDNVVLLDGRRKAAGDEVLDESSVPAILANIGEIHAKRAA